MTEEGRVRFGIAGMRKFNASKEEVIERGRALDKQGHNFAKATLAFIGRVAYNHLKDKQRTLERKIVFGD